jgi:hypothetical protein
MDLHQRRPATLDYIPVTERLRADTLHTCGRTARVRAPAQTLEQFQVTQLLVTYDFRANISDQKSYRVSLAFGDVGAQRADTNAAVTVTAPPGFAQLGERQQQPQPERHRDQQRTG